MTQMTDSQREQKHISISDLAEKYLEEALAQGHPFTEGLCSWAISKAEQNI